MCFAVTVKVSRMPHKCRAWRTYFLVTEVKACYTLSDQGFSILYEVKSDRPTFCNLTNHVYLNLDGEGTVHDHILMMNAPCMWRNDDWHIPSMCVDTKGTVFDFGKGKQLDSAMLPMKKSAGLGGGGTISLVSTAGWYWQGRI